MSSKPANSKNSSLETGNPTLETSSPPFPPHFPLSHLTLLLGDPGVGKSLLATHLAASLSNGLSPISELETGNFPLETRSTPSGTMIFSAEDTYATIQSRLTAAGANLDHAKAVSAIDECIPIAPGHLQATCRRYLTTFAHSKISLFVFDPITPYLGHDPRRANSVRQSLLPLAQVAREFTACALMIHHLNKRLPSSAHPLHRALDSLAFPAVARSVLYLTRHPATGERLLLSLKSNTTAPLPALSMQITPAGTITLHPTSYTTEEILNLPTPAIPSEASLQYSRERREAIDFLNALLKDGPRPAREILRQAREAGITEHTLRRAKSVINISITHDGPTNRWFWSLSTQQVP